MARQYVITDEEMQSLIESLELTSLRLRDSHALQSPIHKQDIDSIHRTFHMVTVRWAQAMGFDGRRK